MQNAGNVDATLRRQDRLLATLERLLELPATEVKVTLSQAAQLIAEVLAADKVDIFFHDNTNETLVALGTSDTPMGRKQKAIGLDRLPMANGGRVVEVFLTGISYLTGHADQDPEELPGVKVGLDIRSSAITVLEAGTQHRGVLLASSATEEFFSEQDLRFLEAVARWLGIVLHRAELIERMKQEAVEQGRRLAAEELLTIMAHDLRNYLTPLKGRLTLVEWRARRDNREQDLRDVGAANHTLRLLERVISDLLDLARLNQGIFVVTPEPVNLVEVVQVVVPAFQTEETEIQVNTPTEVTLPVDPERMRQVLENLLANAITHAPKHTPIEVRITIERRGDGPWVLLTVSNQGTGISPERIATLFHPFVAGTQSTGLGLGLYLANRIAQAHDGTLTVDSPEGQGVHITLALPVEEEELIVRE